MLYTPLLLTVGILGWRRKKGGNEDKCYSVWRQMYGAGSEQYIAHVLRKSVPLITDDGSVILKFYIEYL